MKSKKPKIIIILIIIFAWFLLKDVEFLVRFRETLDYTLFHTVGMEGVWLFFLIVLAILHGSTIWFLFKPRPVGFWVAITSLAVSAIEDVIAFVLMLRNPGVAQEGYRLSREARGLPVREEFFDIAFSPLGIYITMGVALGGLLLVGILLFKKRNYFSNESSKISHPM